MAWRHHKNWRYQLYKILKRPERFETYKFRARCFEEVRKHGNDLPSIYLRRILDFAQTHVPYYRDLMGDRKDWAENFQDLPPLTKKIVQENFERLKSDDIDRRQCTKNYSGGSTGKPLEYLREPITSAWSLFARVYYLRDFWDLDFMAAPQIRFWAAEKDLFKLKQRSFKQKILDWIHQEEMLDTFVLTPEKIRAYVARINRKKPLVIYGIGGSLYEIAKFTQENNLRIHPPRLVCPRTEMLHPHMRALIEEQFGCKASDAYGAREVGTIAGECREGKMHIFNFNNVLEVVNKDNRPVAPGEEGDVLVTNLHNRAMPFIRYALEDRAVLGKECACGNRFPVLEKITGRIIEHFRTPDGRLVSGALFNHGLRRVPWIGAYQVLQTDLNRLKVYYVRKGEEARADVENANQLFRKLMGADCRIEWIKVDEVPKTPDGKLMHTKSLVSRND